MSFFSEILDVGVMDILMTQKDKLLNNIKIEVTFEELEKVVKEKEFFLIKISLIYFRKIQMILKQLKR